MGFLDVLRGEQSVSSWLTGREKEADLDVEPEKAKESITELNRIADSVVSTACSSVCSAVSTFNSITGVSLLGGINAGAGGGNIQAIYEAIGAQIRAFSGDMQGKLDDAEYYNKPLVARVFGTAAMAVGKVGEGLLSVVEDLGDGVASVVGWIAPSGSKLEEAMTNFVKADWSHDAMSKLVYEHVADYSAITEDSALAGACLITGKAVGYLYAGGAITGFAGAAGLGGTAVGQAALGVASGTTWGATAAAALGGLGSGTEAGLYKGKNINEAFTHEGLKTAAIQGGLAFAGGKLGEKMAKNAAVKEATKAADKADEVFQGAKQAEAAAAKDLQGYDNAVKMAEADMENGVLGAAEQHSAALRDFTLAESQYKDAAKALLEATSGVDDAATALTNAQNASLSSFQGYSDSVTKAGIRFGETSYHTASDGLQALGQSANAAWKGRFGNPVEHEAAAQAAQNAKDAFRSDLSALARENPISQGVSALGSGLKSAGQAVTHPGQTLKNAGESLKEFAQHPVQNTVAGIKDLVTNPATPGVVATVGYNAIDEATNGKAEQQFRQTKPINPDNTSGGATPDPGSLTGSPVPTDPGTTPPGNPGSPGSPGGPGGTPPSSTTPTTPQTTTPPTTEPITPATTTPVPTTPAHTPTGGETHSGGQFTGTGGYTGEELPGGDLADSAAASIDEILKGKKYSKIPTSSGPISRNKVGSSGSAVIPISAGLSAAAAVGLGAKAYLDKKSEDEDEGFEDNWDNAEIEIEQDNTVEEDDSLLEEGFDPNKTLQNQIIESISGEDVLDY